MYLCLFGKNAPSNKITVGFIGTGGHGTGWNLPSYLSQKDAKVLMTCDVDTNRMNHAKKIVDQNYGNKDCTTSKDFRAVQPEVASKSRKSEASTSG